MNEKIIIRRVYKKFTGIDPVDMSRLPKSGSDRIYFRIIETNRSVIGVYNPNREENNTFIGFSKHFASRNLHVPEIFQYFPDDNVYFLQDLGDSNLYTWLERRRQLSGMDETVSEFFRLSLDKLIMFQTKGAMGLDLELCYPHKSFDRQSMMWDLNYFKYMFLKLVSVPFNEQRLEKDFNHLVGMLLDAGQDFFLYRDFQSANIMVLDNEPWFIDYQGGRMGAPQYDLASLLYDSKAHIPPQMREIMLEYFVEKFCMQTGYSETRFRDMYPGFVLIRIMQALGAYGFRGLFEQKPGFVQSIIPAIRDINSVIEMGSLRSELPELASILKAISETRKFETLKEPEILRIKISSFSYMNGIPHDSVHGGGFVYDCRGLTNPGKNSEFRDLSGLDKEVAGFMQKEQDVISFLDDAFRMLNRSIESYKNKNYTSLAVSFGCTGGQHRSVFCADALAGRLKSVEGIDIEVEHRDIQN